MLVTVDTGGTKTLVAGFNRDGTIVSQFKFPTPPVEEDFVTLLKSTLEEQFGSYKDIEAIAIAMPGTIVDNIVVWCTNLKWQNFDVICALQGTLGNVPIFLDNDANLAGLAETRAITPLPISSLYVTVSTGIGTGITTNGRIDPGLRRSEGGRMRIEYNGKLQEWEDFASGQTIHNVYGLYGSEITDPKTWDDIADRISRGFLVITPLLQPDVIIIGGSIGTYFEHYGEKLETLLRKQLPPHIPCPTFVQAQHPEQAVIYGCYYYAIDSLADSAARS